MTKRKEILTQILQGEDIQKIAQEAGHEVVDQSAADKAAADIFDQIFNDEMQKLMQSS